MSSLYIYIFSILLSSLPLLWLKMLQLTAQRCESNFPFGEKILENRVDVRESCCLQFSNVIVDIVVVGVAAAACAQVPLYLMCTSATNQKIATRIYGARDNIAAAHYPEVIVYQMKVDHFLLLLHFFYLLFARFMLFVFFHFSSIRSASRVWGMRIRLNIWHRVPNGKYLIKPEMKIEDDESAHMTSNAPKPTRNVEIIE